MDVGSLEGNGVIIARGGRGNGDGGGGSGGRIAINYTSSLFTGRLIADGGYGGKYDFYPFPTYNKSAEDDFENVVAKGEIACFEQFLLLS